MDFKPPLSLKHMTCAKVAVSLWSQDHVMQWAAQLCYKPEEKLGNLETQWRVLEDKVIENAQKFILPQTVKEQLIRFVAGVGREILHWFHFHYFLCVKKFPDKFLWTNAGTIDRRRTAELMMQNETLDIKKRYSLACTYCFMELVCLLIDKEYGREELGVTVEPALVAFWGFCFIQGNLEAYLTAMRSGQPIPSTLSSYGFCISTAAGNIDATKFFYQVESKKINSMIARDMAIMLAKQSFRFDVNLPQKYHADVFCFLLSVLNEEEQMQVFKCVPFETLRFLLHWPWHEHFVKTLPRIWNFFSQQDYRQLLQLLLLNATMGYQDFCYKDIFKECWQNMCQMDKCAIINEGFLRQVLNDLFRLADLQLIDMIFNDVTVSQSKTLFFTVQSLALWLKLLKDQNYDLLAYYVTRCLSDSEYRLMQILKDFDILHSMSLTNGNSFLFKAEERSMVLIFLSTVCKFEEEEEYIHHEVAGKLARYLEAKLSVPNCYQSFYQYLQRCSMDLAARPVV